MKADDIKIANRSGRKLPCILATSITRLLSALLLILTIESSFADSGTWVGSFNGDWNFVDLPTGLTNWTSNPVPNGPADTATFATSTITSVFLSANTEVNGVVFNPGADAFTISVNSNLILTISGVGVTNNSGTTQTFVTNGGAVAGATGGLTLFNVNSTAANGTFINNGGMVASANGANGGHTQFNGTSTAANGTFINNGGMMDHFGGGKTEFHVNSTAANGTFINNGGMMPGAFIGETEFFGASRAANGTFINNGAVVADAGGGITEFHGSSRADSGNFTNNGGMVAHAGGGSTQFFNTSKADSATLIANGGSDGGLGGGILFHQDSTGGTARVEVFGNGHLDISDHNATPVTIGSIEGDGNVLLGANNLTVGSNNMATTFSGVMSGAGGSLTKVGAGTLVLTETNTYTGGTTIRTGTLQLGNGGTSGSILGDVVNNGTFAINRSDTFTFGGVISGAGAFQQLGTGTTILTGANTYLGITTINAGVLSISSDANLGTAPGAPVADQLTFNGGTLQTTASFDLDTNRGITLLSQGGTIGVTNDNVLSYGGVITGTGSLTKTDTGTLVLSGVNRYIGATTVNGGTLKAGVANTLPSATALTVATGATFDLNNFAQSIGSLAGAGSVTLGTATLTTGNNNTSTHFSGVISGLGHLTKVRTGTQILSGENTYTGGTTINSGRLQLGNGGTSGSIVGDVGNDGTFAVNRSDTFTFGGVISGSGAFVQIGPGTTILTGANTYTGVTAVNAGSLIVDGSIASAETFVNAGGLLGGGGIIGGDLTNAGIVSPGSPNSPGTLTVAGNYIQTTGGTLRIEVAGLGVNQHDMLVVNGKATLAGTLEVIPLNNFQFEPGNKITFLTAKGGVSGTFKPLENPFLLISIDNFSIPKTVALEVLAVSAPPPFVSTFNIGVSLANIQTVNLERRMDDIHAGSRGFSAPRFTINGSTPNFSGGLAGPTGPEGKSGPPVMEPTPENRWGVFVTGLGEFTNIGDTSNARGFDLTTGGLTFGADYRVSPNFAIGLTGGYANTNVDLVNNGSLGVNGGTIGAYATGFGGGFYVDVAAFGVFNGYDSHRTALLGTASGDTDGQDFNALALAGYDWKSGGLTIGPLASYQYTYVGFDSFTEHGSVAPLSFSNQNAESSRTALGAKASYDWHAGHVLIRPEIRASWQHEFGDTEYSIVSRLADGAGNSFSVNGPAVGRDSLLIGAGAAVIFNDRVSVYAYYDGELARSNYSSNNISAGLRFTF